jgi:hypothetical protein
LAGFVISAPGTEPLAEQRIELSELEELEGGATGWDRFDQSPGIGRGRRPIWDLVLDRFCEGSSQAGSPREADGD